MKLRNLNLEYYCGPEKETGHSHKYVAFFLDNPVLDLGNLDRLDFYVSWNKNPKNDRSVPFIIHRPLSLFVC